METIRQFMHETEKIYKKRKAHIKDYLKKKDGDSRYSLRTIPVRMT